MFVLGNRFSGLVAIQPGHTLETHGVYRYIRNPSYLALLMMMLGWGLISAPNTTTIAITRIGLIPGIY